MWHYSGELISIAKEWIDTIPVHLKKFETILKNPFH